MASRVETQPSSFQTETWVAEIVEDNKIKLSSSSGKSNTYEFGAVLFEDKGATYNFKDYCQFQGKDPCVLLKRIKDIRVTDSGDGIPGVLTFATARFARINNK